MTDLIWCWPDFGSGSELQADETSFQRSLPTNASTIWWHRVCKY